MSLRTRLRTVATLAGALVAALAMTGATFENVMRHRAVATLQVPGRLVDVGGGRRIQMDCRGSGSPTVVLESGLDSYGSLSWARVHDSIATSTRVCAYSRAGIMWSDRRSGRFSSEAVARDLHAALLASGEKAPWVLVGHSLGGPYIMTFTALYGAEVGGMVLVDASHPDQFRRFRKAVGKSIQPTAELAAIGDRLAWTGLVRLMYDSSALRAQMPADIAAGAAAFFPTSLHELRAETESISSTLADASAERLLGNRPLVVLSAGKTSPDEIRTMGLTAEQANRLARAKLELKEDQARWSSNGRHEVVPGASHYIQFDRPDVVIRSVREVVAATGRASKQ